MTTPVVALRQALPYLRLYRGQTFVVKCGGELFDAAESAFAIAEQVALLHQLGIGVVLVHGGGPQASRVARSRGLEPVWAAGRRITDAAMLGAVVDALHGDVRTSLLDAASRAELPVAPLSGADDGILHARRRMPVEVEGTWVDYGFVGDLTSVDTAPIVAALAEGRVPAIAPLASGPEGRLNVNADTAAAAIASALGAAKLVFVTEAPGILRDASDPGSLISHLDLGELNELGQSGALQGGMMPKSAAIRQALTDGVGRVHVVSFGYPDAILVEVFTNEGCGTLIVRDGEDHK